MCVCLCVCVCYSLKRRQMCTPCIATYTPGHIVLTFQLANRSILLAGSCPV